jgi:hypothetical protein
MKKAYSQPDILFESFSLSSSIAATCAFNITTQYNGNCAVMYGDKAVFTGDIGACLVKVADGSPIFNGLCYHVPVSQNSIFNS